MSTAAIEIPLDRGARINALASLADRRGLDGVLVYSWRRRTVAWFCGYQPGFATNWAALWVPVGGRPTLGVRFPFETLRAGRVSGLSPIVAADPVDLVPRGAHRVGVVAGDFAVDELPASVAARLRDRGLEMTRLEPEIDLWHSAKTEAEIRDLSNAASVAANALSAGDEVVAAGGDDYTLAAAVEAASRAAGAARALCLVGVGAGAVISEQEGRQLDPAQPISVEFTTWHPRATSHVLHTYASPAVAKRHAEARLACEAARAAIVSALIPGHPVDEAVSAGEDKLAELSVADYQEYDFGHGLGIEIPEYPRLVSGLGHHAAEGQVISVHVAVRGAPQGSWATGGPVLITSNGCVELVPDAPWSAR